MAMMRVTLEPIGDNSIHSNVIVNGVDLSKYIRAVDYHAHAGSVPVVSIDFISHLELRNVPTDVRVIIDALQDGVLLDEIGDEAETIAEKGKHDGGS